MRDVENYSRLSFENVEFFNHVDVVSPDGKIELNKFGGYGVLGMIIHRIGNEYLPVNLFSLQVVHYVITIFDEALFQSEQLRCSLYHRFLRKTGMPSFGRPFLQGMRNPGAYAEFAVPRDSDFQRDFVRGNKPYALDVRYEHVRIRFHYINRAVAVFAIYFERKVHRNVVFLQKKHAFFHSARIFITNNDFHQFLFPDSADFYQPFGVVFENVEGFYSKLVDYLFRKAFAYALEQTA